MKYLKLGVVIIILAALSAGAYYLFGNYGEGYRAGIMIKFSKKGNVFKTYEGELNLGMILHEAPQDLSVSNIWRFSVPSSKEDVIKQLEDAVMNGKRVKIHYNEKFVVLPWRGDTKYLVDGVETAK